MRVGVFGSKESGEKTIIRRTADYGSDKFKNFARKFRRQRCFFVGTGTNGGLSPDVIRILKLGKKAIPLLIAHLDDRRFFKRLKFCCLANQDQPRKVNVSEAALEILTIIVRQNKPMFDLECITEGPPESRCVAENYYEGETGKRNRLKAYRAGKIQYEKYEY